MRIEIEIPKEFEKDYIEERFKDFFNRILTDIIFFDGLCGNYEKETAEMFRKAFAKSKVAYDVEAVVAELEKSKKRLMLRNGNMGKTFYIPVNTAISIVRGKEQGMKKITKTEILLVLFVACVIIFGIGTDIGSKGCVASSLIGIIAIGAYWFLKWIYDLMKYDD